MRYLKNYLRFDFKAFTEKMSMKVKRIEEWKDYDTKEIMGTKIALTIEDDTVYEKSDGGMDEGANEGETLVVKVRKPISQFADWKRRDFVSVPEVEKATVYGDYMDKLSVIGDVYNMEPERTNYCEMKNRKKKDKFER